MRTQPLSGKIVEYKYDELNRLTSEKVAVSGTDNTRAYQYAVLEIFF